MEKKVSEAIVSLHTARYLSFRYLVFQNRLSKAIESAVYMTMDLTSSQWLGLSDILKINEFLAATILKSYLKVFSPGICLSNEAILRQKSMIDRIICACLSCRRNAGANRNGFYLKKNEIVLVMEDIPASNNALVEIPIEQKALVPYLKIDKW